MSEAELCATRCQRPTEALVEKPCTGVFALSCNQLELSYKHVFVEVNYLGVSMQIQLSETGRKIRMQSLAVFLVIAISLEFGNVFQ